MALDVVDLASRLVQIDTTNPPGDQTELIDLVDGLLRQYGHSPRIHTYDGVPNLVVERGSGARPLLVLNGHWDVVPPGPGWERDPFSGKVADGRLWGRGSADMKGGVAAMVAAFLDLEDDELEGTVILQVVGDEEIGGERGTGALLSELSAEIDFMIGGEATDLMIKTERRGAVWATIEFHGVQSHAARPDQGINPLQGLGRAMSLLGSLDLGAGTTLSMTMVEAGEKINVIPSIATLHCDIRNIAAHTTDWIEEQLRGLLDGLGDIEYYLKLEEASPAFSSPRGKLVEIMSTVVRDVTGGVAQIAEADGGSSDACFFAARGAEVAEFGVRGSRIIHKVDEYCEIEDLETCRRVYSGTIRKLLGANSSPRDDRG